MSRRRLATPSAERISAAPCAVQAGVPNPFSPAFNHACGWSGTTQPRFTENLSSLISIPSIFNRRHEFTLRFHSRRAVAVETDVLPAKFAAAVFRVLSHDAGLSHAQEVITRDASGVFSGRSLPLISFSPPPCALQPVCAFRAPSLSPWVFPATIRGRRCRAQVRPRRER